MILETNLTVGWPTSSSQRSSAPWIHQQCMDSDSNYAEALKQILQENQRENPRLCIENIEGLFRRRSRGFSGIKKFVGALNACVHSIEGLKEIDLEVDAFAYAFLCGAKNFDFVLPQAAAQASAADHTLYTEVKDRWDQKLRDFEMFESHGEFLEAKEKQRYLALRSILSRRGARDEFRALATLLVSGPSTGSEISKDLGMPYDLSDRILPSLGRTGVTEMPDELEGRYRISLDAIPCVVFILREVGGIDLLPILKETNRQ